MTRAFAEIAFTPEVRAAQERLGSADAYAGFLAPEAERADRLGPEEAAFVEARDGFYQASVGADGWPYVQFRGGPRGFLRALDERTLGYADFRGNRQYVSLGNLTGNDRASLILMDYPNRRRLKVWGRVRFSEDPGIIEALTAPGARGRPERAALIEIAALDWNCPQHIPRRFTAEELGPELAAMRSRIDALTGQLRAARAAGA